MNVLNTSTNATNETVAITAPTTPIASASGRARIAIGFLTRSNDAALVMLCERILVAMTSNADYPAPVPALAVIATARTSLIAAGSAVKSGTLAVVARRQQRAQLVALLRSLALYVQQTCNGDLATLLTSGYPARKIPAPVGQLPAPANLRLARGSVSGQLKARCNRVGHAGSYQWRYATAAAPTVLTLTDPTLAASKAFNGLVPGTLYVVQVRVVGTQGPSDWSDSASLMVV